MFNIKKIFTLFAIQNSGGFYESIHKTTDRQCPAFCAGPGTSLFDRTSSTDWQYAAAHALSCFSLWMAVCAVFRLSAAHLPQHDLRHATHVPVAIAMAFELAAYGLIAGLIYGHSKQKSTASLYIALISAMILGRVVWGIVEVLLLGIGENAFTWQMFLSGALLEAIPGIILQLILIPGILVALRRSGHFPL